MIKIPNWIFPESRNSVHSTMSISICSEHTEQSEQKKRDLLRDDVPYLVNNFSHITNLLDWIVIQDILTHANLCIISIHADGKYIFNITFMNNRVYALNDRIIKDKTIIRHYENNSYLIEVPMKNFQLQFSYGKPIRFRYNNKIYKYLTVVTRFYIKRQSDN